MLWSAPEPTGPWTRTIVLDIEAAEANQQQQEPKRRLYYAAKLHPLADYLPISERRPGGDVLCERAGRLAHAQGLHAQVLPTPAPAARQQQQPLREAAGPSI